MPSYNELRVSKLDKEIEELVKESQEGSEVKVKEIEDPTQSSEVAKEESSSEVAKEIAEQTKVDKTEDTVDYWKERALVSERRYNVSKPKYDSNIFTLKQENIKLQESVVNLQTKLNEVIQSVASKKGNKFDELFDDKTVDVLGADTTDKLKTAFKETNDRVDEQEKIKAEEDLKNKRTNIQKQIQSTHDDFVARLTKIVPDQAKINLDKGFLKYLGGVDSLGGSIRFDVLRAAQKSHDVGRVAQFFIEYKKLTEGKTEATKDSINKRIAPTSSSNSTSVGDISDKGFISMAFVDKFYSDITKGVYKGRFKEQQKIEAIIDKAYLAGKLTE